MKFYAPDQFLRISSEVHLTSASTRKNVDCFCEDAVSYFTFFGYVAVTTDLCVVIHRAVFSFLHRKIDPDGFIK